MMRENSFAICAWCTKSLKTGINNSHKNVMNFPHYYYMKNFKTDFTFLLLLRTSHERPTNQADDKQMFLGY